MKKSHYFYRATGSQAVDSNGMYGEFGGSFVSEKMKADLATVKEKFDELKRDDNFLSQIYGLMCGYVGRPSPLYYADKLSQKYGAKIYLKREDLNHTGAHKINNSLGQIFLAKKNW